MERIKNLEKYSGSKRCFLIFILAIIGFSPFLILPLMFITVMCVLSGLDDMLKGNDLNKHTAWVEPIKPWSRR